MQTMRQVSVRPCPASMAQPRSLVAQRTSVRANAGLAKWDVMYNTLNDKSLQSIQPEAAADLVAAGKWVIVDVRPPKAYEAAHIEGSINVPMYKALDPLTSGFGGALKFVLYSLNGVAPVETNANFLEEMKEVTVGGTKGVIVACEAGGTLKPSTNFEKGKASRSLQAAFRAIVEADIPRTMHLDRGLYGWYQAELPFVGEYKPDVGRTPSAASDPTLKTTVQSMGYQMREGDKK